MRERLSLARLVSKVLELYIYIVYKTSKISVDGIENLDDNNKVVGFWHGDSFLMYLLLKHRNTREGYIFTTIDSRGDYITHLARSYNLGPVRLTNGQSGGRFAKEFKDVVKSSKNLYVTLDGPLGPYHEPKELPFKVGVLKKSEFLSVGVRSRSVVSLKKRWDKYKIPLPFGRYEFHLSNSRVIKREDLREFHTLSRSIREEINGQEYKLI